MLLRGASDVLLERRNVVLCLSKGSRVLGVDLRGGRGSTNGLSASVDGLGRMRSNTGGRGGNLLLVVLLLLLLEVVKLLVGRGVGSRRLGGSLVVGKGLVAESLVASRGAVAKGPSSHGPSSKGGASGSELVRVLTVGVKGSHLHLHLFAGDGHGLGVFGLGPELGNVLLSLLNKVGEVLTGLDGSLVERCRQNQELVLGGVVGTGLLGEGLVGNGHGQALIGGDNGGVWSDAEQLGGCGLDLEGKVLVSRVSQLQIVGCVLSEGSWVSKRMRRFRGDAGDTEQTCGSAS